MGRHVRERKTNLLFLEIDLQTLLPNFYLKIISVNQFLRNNNEFKLDLPLKIPSQPKG
jgi:hypothetical protein